MIFIEEALTTWVLDEYPYSAITKETLALQIYIFYKTKVYKNERISQIRKPKAGNGDFENNISKLLRSGVLTRIEESDYMYNHPYLRGGFYDVFTIKGKREYSNQEIICSTYPYGYLSYISAMEWHGITDKIPNIIRFTTCPSSVWKEKSLASLKKEDIEDVDKDKFIPRFPRTTKIQGMEVLVSQETSFTPPLKARESPVKVSNIGKTFIDMLRKPEYCGGDEHVLEVYLEHGEKYAGLIIKNLEKFGRTIDIARAGFILDKMLGVKDERLDFWKKESSKTRGSSKVLSKNKPFSEVFDQDWSLSLNIEMASKYGK